MNAKIMFAERYFDPLFPKNKKNNQRFYVQIKDMYVLLTNMHIKCDCINTF